MLVEREGLEREWLEPQRRRRDDEARILSPRHEALLDDRGQARFVEEQGPKG